MNPLALIALQTQAATLMLETQVVMTLRILGMAGILPSSKGENDRMVSEKGPAMIKAMTAGTAAAMAGKRPDQIMSAALAPLSSKVHSNRVRLMK